ncbi:MAG TPA: hypothetical protein VHO69_19400 [Phototrophicaceae bacterium]|nr:hypothetical protein [Phototrophicaceae bacterium]
MMLKQMILLILLSGALVLAGPVAAQSQPDYAPVYVTTQDYTVLRAGPGENWERLAVLPYGTTYRATGRTLYGRWLQIVYEGELDAGARTDFTVDGVTYGWVAYWLLTWTGNILQLPLDGVKLVPTAREAGPIIYLGAGSYIYERGVNPATRVAYPTDYPYPVVRVEVTGRLGSPDNGYFMLQLKFNNHYYWTGTWAVGVPGEWWNLPDAAYLYPYGRLLIQLRREISHAGDVLDDIGGRWRSLDEGYTTTCNDIPEDFTLRESSFSALDLDREPIYRPTAAALLSARDNINAALGRFRQICSQPGDRLVNPAEISAALAEIEAAERYLTVARTLLPPLQNADPAFAGNSSHSGN